MKIAPGSSQIANKKTHFLFTILVFAFYGQKSEKVYSYTHIENNLNPNAEQITLSAFFPASLTRGYGAWEFTISYSGQTTWALCWCGWTIRPPTLGAGKRRKMSKCGNGCKFISCEKIDSAGSTVSRGQSQKWLSRASSRKPKLKRARENAGRQLSHELSPCSEARKSRVENSPHRCHTQ